MRWVFAVLTGALGVAACAWWLAPAAVPPPPSRSPAASPTLTAAPAADVPDAHSPTPAPEVERTNVAGRATAADAASGPGPTLVVVAGDPARPVADAEVYFAAERLDPSVNRFEIPERFGDRTRTDRDGRVTLPGGSGRLLVAARHADRFGFAAVARSPATHRLLLQADEQVRIAVRHADGRPAAGVPLSALQTGPRRTRRIWTGV
ncbi:MAG TPA: hypothetical protein ENI87_13955, partial [bacterium]|nr:hypothetical protein [bacterium]